MKPALTFEEQLSHLINEKKLRVKNKNNVLRILSEQNYYRLSGYWKFFLNQDDIFFDNINFEKIYEIYEFDKIMRNHIIEIIIDIELYFKTRLSYYLAHKYGPLGYLDKENFDNRKQDQHEKLLEMIENIKSSLPNNPIIKHHQVQYDGNIPIWALVEFITFGATSKLFSIMKDKDQKEFTRSAYKNISHIHLNSFIHSLTTLRNTCCHFQRLYKAIPIIKAGSYSVDYDKYNSDDVIVKNSISYSIFIALMLTPSKDMCDAFINKVLVDMNICHINPYDYGMKDGWEELFRFCSCRCINNTF